MRRYLAIRLASTAFTLWASVTILFLVVRMVPGDPTMFFLQEGAPPQVIQRQKELWGIADPLHIQYLRYIKNIAVLDFGESFRMHQPVRDLVMPKLLNTWAMMLPSVLLMVVIGATAGAFVGWRRGTRLEAGATMFTLFMNSIPSFFAGMLALSIFAFGLGWLPSGGMRAAGENLTFIETVFNLEFLKYLALPLFVLVIRGYDGPFLVMRTAMIEMRGEDFVEVLRAKGLSNIGVVKHAARNAALPLVTYVAVMVGFLFQGQVILETIFSWPGIGREIVRSVQNTDYPVTQAAFFLTATTIIMMNLLVDILYGYLDPRIKYN